MKYISGLALAVSLAIAGAASAQSTSVYDYALQHPTADANLPAAPSIGASVPQSVEIQQIEGGNGIYGYFYYEGRPVIVELSTRAIVRIG